jgi:ABC-2 type transport system ATP-binding protein
VTTTAPTTAASDLSALEPPAIRTSGLTRRFGSQVAVDGVDLVVPHGAVFGFLGPNGSGKTTTIRMLLGLLSADDGDIELLGSRMPDRLSEVLPRVGALIEGPAFHPYLSGVANLRRMDRADATADPATSADRIAAALARVGLTAAAGKKFRNYSLGMKQRLGLAAALLQPRDLLVLDEPTNGLDPQGTREVRHLVHDLASDGTTVLVSSHLLSEVEQVATHVGIMSGGRLLRQGTLTDVLSDGTAVVRVTTPDLDVVRRALDDGTPRRDAVGVGRRRGRRRRCAAARPGRHAAGPRGPVRVPDRGGLRCPRLTSRSGCRAAATGARSAGCTRPSSG